MTTDHSSRKNLTEVSENKQTSTESESFTGILSNQLEGENKEKIHSAIATSTFTCSLDSIKSHEIKCLPYRRTLHPSSELINSVNGEQVETSSNILETTKQQVLKQLFGISDDIKEIQSNLELLKGKRDIVSHEIKEQQQKIDMLMQQIHLSSNKDVEQTFQDDLSEIKDSFYINVRLHRRYNESIKKNSDELQAKTCEYEKQKGVYYSLSDINIETVQDDYIENETHI